MKLASQTQLGSLVPSGAEAAPLLEKHYHPSLITTHEVWQAFHPNRLYTSQGNVVP